MSRRIVKTKAELEKAKNDKVDAIIVEGKLAEDLKKAKQVTTLGAGALATLTTLMAAATALAPVTGGASLAITAAAAAPIAAATGLSIPAIVAVSVLGVALIVALAKDYDIEVCADTKTVRLTRK